MSKFDDELEKMVANIEIEHKAKADTTKQTPIEIALGVDENGEVSAKSLYEWLELNPKNYSHWCKRNITENGFAEENVDFRAFVLNDEWGGQATTDYKLTAHFAKKLSMKGNGKRAEQAREYFTTLEEKVKETVNNRSELSPQLQMVYAMLDIQAKQELEQKRQAEQINKVEMTVTTMRDIFTEPIGDWQNDINKRVREIAVKSGTPYNEMWGKLYGELEVTAHCSLKRLAENKRKRMQKAGNTKQAITKGTSKLAIIHDNTRLKLIFEDIVKKYAMAYVGVEKAEV